NDIEIFLTSIRQKNANQIGKYEMLYSGLLVGEHHFRNSNLSKLSMTV
ncbi:14817_t:CDS:1, partial [Funneliformis geosporum]